MSAQKRAQRYRFARDRANFGIARAARVVYEKIQGAIPPQANDAVHELGQAIKKLDELVAVGPANYGGP